MSKTITGAIVVMASLAVAAKAASAHPRLQSSTPAAGATLKTSPTEIRMNFSEELVAAFSGVDVKTGDGKAVPTGKMKLAPGDMRKIILPVTTRLAPGSYRVAWHAVSVDTHRVSGQYSFKVAR